MPSSSNAKISFYREGNVRLNLPPRAGLRKLLSYIFKTEKRSPHMLTYVFCNDRYLLKLNQKFLKHDEYTDIITFDLSEGRQLEGEIYISVDRIRENAKSLGIPIKRELVRVMIHGALHLCGYGDKTKSQQKKMRQREDYYLARYFG